MSLYYPNNKIKYQGELLNEIPHGEGIAFFENGNKKFEGTFVNGTFTYGKIYFHNGSLKYEGECNDKILHGEGKKYNSNGVCCCSGRFENGKCVEGLIYDACGDACDACDYKSTRERLRDIKKNLVIITPN